MDQNTLYKLFPSWSLLSVDFLNTCTKMDPQFRPTADELLKHNYFIQDRFPEKFLPALREKVKIEFNDNPLLRKFKAEIFMSAGDYRREEIRPKRAQVEPPRWRINFVQGSVKRKFSSDTINSEDSRSLISLNKSGQKLSSSIQKLGQISKNGSLQAIKRDENSLQAIKREDKTSPNVSENKFSGSSFIVPKISQEKYSQRDNPRLEKALDLLSKLNKKNQYCRPKSTNKDLHTYSNLPTSPPEFQSLQSQSFREVSKSPPTQVLHPNITNIGFQNRESRKTPPLIQSVNNLSLKSVFSQVPVTNPPKTHYLKKLERYVVVDTSPMNQERHNSPPDWMSSVGVAQKKRDPWAKSRVTDEFTLPVVPGGRFYLFSNSPH